VSLNSTYHLVCGNQQCSFRVHDRYFEDKRQFAPGVCPNCGGVIEVHVAYGARDPLMKIETNPASNLVGKVVEA